MTSTTNWGKSIISPTFVTSECSTVFVEVFSKLLQKLILKLQTIDIAKLLFLLTMDSTKSYQYLPDKIDNKLDYDSAAFTLWLKLASDRFHKNQLWTKDLPNVHQKNFVLKLVQYQNACCETGMITLCDNSEMNVECYKVEYWDSHWKKIVTSGVVRNELCQFICALCAIEDSQYVYPKEEYECKISFISQLLHCFKHLGALASHFLMAEILCKNIVSEAVLTKRIRLKNFDGEYWSVSAVFLPTFIFRKLLDVCQYKLPVFCWQNEKHCYWGWESITLLLNSNWSKFDPQPVAHLPAYQQRIKLEITKFSIETMLNNRYNASVKSGSGATVEVLHRVFNQHDGHRGKKNVYHTKSTSSAQAWKKNKMAEYEENHLIDSNVQEWQSVRMNMFREELLSNNEQKCVLNQMQSLPNFPTLKEMVGNGFKVEQRCKNNRNKSYKILKQSNSVALTNQNTNSTFETFEINKQLRYSLLLTN